MAIAAPTAVQMFIYNVITHKFDTKIHPIYIVFCSKRDKAIILALVCEHQSQTA